MGKTWKEVVELVFKGKRFDDHGIDVEALTEIITFQDIITETAKGLWLRNNPKRKNLMRHFDRFVRLRITNIEAKCVRLPMSLPVCTGKGAQEGMFQAPLPEAVEAVNKTYGFLRSLETDRETPEDLPRSVLPLFSDFGKTLKRGESLSISIPKNGEPEARLDNDIRAKIDLYIPKHYTDQVEYEGLVLMADVKKGDFVLYPDPHTAVAVSFKPDDELKITTALRDHETARVRVLGKGEFYANGEIKRIFETENIEVITTAGRVYDDNAKPIEEELAELANKIPIEEWRKLPRDGSENLDHYIYGAKKR